MIRRKGRENNDQRLRLLELLSFERALWHTFLNLYSSYLFPNKSSCPLNLRQKLGLKSDTALFLQMSPRTVCVGAVAPDREY